ncbi:MAG: YkgJ family cysteine cluster protein [Proteobacteria bacterium]|nr:YkgJ family cysteine cluster protein [Pseudomonadota bacterium]
MDFKPILDKYETYVQMIDGIFKKVGNEYGYCVKCKPGCDDCCYALFDLSFIEAVYINRRFKENFSGDQRSLLIEKAARADRQIHKLKKSAFQQLKHGRDEIGILGDMAMERVRCPFLNEKSKCDMYDMRPITCRLYGIPTSTSGASHICGKSAFEKGGKYPTVNMDKIHNQLYNLSLELAIHIKSRYAKIAEVLIPLSMALITDFNEEYLGVGDAKKTGEEDNLSK